MRLGRRPHGPLLGPRRSLGSRPEAVPESCDVGGVEGVVGYVVAGKLEVDVPGLKNVTAVALGEKHTCALTNTGAVWCWGLNDRGQLGARAAARCKLEYLADDSTVPCSLKPLSVFR